MQRKLLLALLFPFALSAQSGFVSVATETMTETGRARGVSVCDFNEDGLPDIYVSMRNTDNLLYRNDGNMTFTEVADAVGLAGAGASSFSLWADFDNDGHSEVVVGNREEPARLYARNETGGFADVTASSGLAQRPYLMSGVAFDYDNDGLLDLYFSCLSCANQLYHNEGNLRFALVGGNAGAIENGLAMGSVALDYDRDGDQDLYLIHDGNEPNKMYRNDGGTFTDVSRETGTDVVGDGMGVDVHDYNRDGWPDIYVSNLFENFLLRNNGDGTFTERGFDTRTNDLGMGWGTAWLDYDLDGWPDIFIANETNFQVGGRRYPNLLYRNRMNGTFEQVTGPDDALASSFSGFGAAVADFDGDGREDIVVVNSDNGPTEVFRNANLTENNWAGIRLAGTVSNRDGIGSRVLLHTSGRDLERQLHAGSSFASQHTKVLHFGLAETTVDSVTVFWPSGRVSTHGAATNAVTLVTEPLPVSTREPVRETLAVSPNPTSGELRFTVPVSGVSVYDVYGRLVQFTTEATDRVQLGSHLPAGVYTVLVGSTRQSGRVVLRR